MIPENSLPDQLYSYFANLHGSDAPTVMLAAMTALSGLTVKPMSGQIVGNGLLHERLALQIEQLLGPVKCRTLTAATEGGILSLEDEEFSKIKCVIYVGKFPNAGVHRSIRNLILGHPLRSLDGTSAGRAKYCEMNRAVSCLLVRCEGAATGRELSQNLLQLVINGSSEQISRMLSGELGVDATDSCNVILPKIQPRVQQIVWSTQVQFDSGLVVHNRVVDAADLSLIRMVLRLASVYQLLRDEPKQDGCTLPGSEESIEAVLKLIEQAKVQDDQVLLSRQECRMVDILRSSRPQLMKPAGDESALPGSGPYTLYNVQDLLKRSPASIDTISLRFKALHNAGLLRPAGKLGRMHAWDLTERGLNFRPGLLVDRLRNMLVLRTNSDNSEQFRGDISPSSVTASGQLGTQ